MQVCKVRLGPLAKDDDEARSESTYLCAWDVTPVRHSHLVSVSRMGKDLEVWLRIRIRPSVSAERIRVLLGRHCAGVRDLSGASVGVDEVSQPTIVRDIL